MHDFYKTSVKFGLYFTRDQRKITQPLVVRNFIKADSNSLSLFSFMLLNKQEHTLFDEQVYINIPYFEIAKYKFTYSLK